MSSDYETDAEYADRLFSADALAERRDDCQRQAQRERDLGTAEKAALVNFKASNPWPTDPTALHGARMGLYELIEGRGD